MSDPDFYVGYTPRAQRGLARFVRAWVAALLAGAAALAGVLVISQQPFDPSRFEFGTYRSFEGVVRNQPVPMLVGATQPVLLVAPGKHGMGNSMLPFEGRHVRLRGSLIERDDHRMVEVLLDSIEAAGEPQEQSVAHDLGTVELTGEIVDTKCYFGVMNPGFGKVHRDCAVRCISGGIPAGFLVRDNKGRGGTLLLASADWRPLNRDILAYVGEPVRIAGTLSRVNGAMTLRTTAASIQRIRE